MQSDVPVHSVLITVYRERIATVNVSLMGNGCWGNLNNRPEVIKLGIAAVRCELDTLLCNL